MLQEFNQNSLKGSLNDNYPLSDPLGNGMVSDGRFSRTNDYGDSLARGSGLFTGKIATAIKNLIPASDKTARPARRGENHAILRLPNGKTGLGNYIGPGTRLYWSY